MPLGDFDELIQSAVPHERPFEGGSLPLDEEQSVPFALYLYPELECWMPLLRRLRVPVAHAAVVAAAARESGADFQSELLASGIVGEESFARALAAELGLAFAPSPDPARLIVRNADAVAFLRRRSWHIPVKIAERNGATSYLVAPERLSLDRLKDLVGRRPEIARRLKLTGPKALRQALLARVRPELARTATSGLFERFPQMSARLVANAWQGAVCGAGIVALPAALIHAPAQTYAALHVFFSLFFLSCVALRFAAVWSPAPLPPAPKHAAPKREMPVYSVLVALYREAEIVPDLIAALDRLVWPRSKLEIKLVCEADDPATLAALASCDLASHYEVVKVPVQGPRTKPKALAYALPQASGDLVALYDAEDNPHPMQLVEAWRRFRRSGPELACVQAPLEVTNRRAGAVAMMFAFEYAALFRGLLPWLARRKLFLPLGGTSNHFRRTALDQVGGWDPYNVTEDADLGVRLARFGYRTEMIASPTFEAGPEQLKDWLPQRTRWFKGWLQTWLVHMRDPPRLARELGPGSFVIVQILLAGMMLSALAHPFLVVTALLLAFELAADRPMSAWRSGMLAIDLVNISCGYASFLLLGWRSLRKSERGGFWKIMAFTPVYWMLISAAAWRAVWHLVRRPHHWEKTPHRRAASDLSGERGLSQRKSGPSPMMLSSGLPIASGSRPA